MLVSYEANGVRTLNTLHFVAALVIQFITAPSTFDGSSSEK